MQNWNERLKKARIERNLTLKEVAYSLGITPQSLIEYEKGSVYPKIDMFASLCELYGVTVNFILYGNESGLSLNTSLQKNIEALISMLIYDQIECHEGTLIIKDSKIRMYFDLFNKFLVEHDKRDLFIVGKIIDGINKLEEVG